MATTDYPNIDEICNGDRDAYIDTGIYWSPGFKNFEVYYNNHIYYAYVDEERAIKALNEILKLQPKSKLLLCLTME